MKRFFVKARDNLPPKIRFQHISITPFEYVKSKNFPIQTWCGFLYPRRFLLTCLAIGRELFRRLIVSLALFWVIMKFQAGVASVKIGSWKEEKKKGNSMQNGERKMNMHRSAKDFITVTRKVCIRQNDEEGTKRQRSRKSAEKDKNDRKFSGKIQFILTLLLIHAKKFWCILSEDLK